MYIQVETHIYLPTYILEYVVDGRVDPDMFLSKATPARFLEVILAFYPHFDFTQDAREDDELLRKIFIEMVALRLSNVVMPLDVHTGYFQAPFNTPVLSEPQQSSKRVNSSADIDVSRTDMFNSNCLAYLRVGQYRHAAENITCFTNTYTFLNQDEILEISNACGDAEDNLHDTLSHLKGAYHVIDRIQLLSRQPDITPTEASNLDHRLKVAITGLRLNQQMFDSAVRDVGFLLALVEHHENRFVKHQSTPEKSGPNKKTTEQDSTPPEKSV
ncbi:uncharacterized protein MELLADRAFT_88691 [Melampsora larici-populina 98AG31]|uniref:Uncharacterized protein n=1 Tax=Melampsora larici-populina (strain 98AG31 / pathotype 3-4-7) TaxID=747676 RepID=F4RSM7_MELLP|nr:uncharacterized protein MELLADRAFT_88691 [Melampsora larici-populina 98AG31]EGG04626.1 hypothetical protein MELLADRAFT_88691 [Melampsora larici-populina 98AG31]